MRRGGVLGAVLLILFGLAVVAVLGVVFVARSIRVREDPTGVRLETPLGSLRVRERHIDPRAFGVPAYPGAVAGNHDSAASVELEFGDNARGLAVVAGTYTTPDPSSKVIEYYRRELPHWIVREKRHGGVEFDLTEGGYKRVIAIQERHGLTRIALASIGEPAAN